MKQDERVVKQIEGLAAETGKADAPLPAVPPRREWIADASAKQKFITPDKSLLVSREDIRGKGRFAQMLPRVWERTDLSEQEKAVVSMLLDYTRTNTFCRPTIGTLMKRLGMSKSAIQRAFRGLKGKGALIIDSTGGRKKASRYYFVRAFWMPEKGGAVAILHDAKKDGASTALSDKTMAQSPPFDREKDSALATRTEQSNLTESRNCKEPRPTGDVLRCAPDVPGGPGGAASPPDPAPLPGDVGDSDTDSQPGRRPASPADRQIDESADRQTGVYSAVITAPPGEPDRYRGYTQKDLAWPKRIIVPVFSLETVAGWKIGNAADPLHMDIPETAFGEEIISKIVDKSGQPIGSATLFGPCGGGKTILMTAAMLRFRRTIEAKMQQLAVEGGMTSGTRHCSRRDELADHLTDMEPISARVFLYKAESSEYARDENGDKRYGRLARDEYIFDLKQSRWIIWLDDILNFSSSKKTIEAVSFLIRECSSLPRRPLVVTTNMPPSRLEQVLPPDCYSRLIGGDVYFVDNERQIDMRKLYSERELKLESQRQIETAKARKEKAMRLKPEGVGDAQH